jgi:hypothetical protein
MYAWSAPTLELRQPLILLASASRGAGWPHWRRWYTDGQPRLPASPHEHTGWGLCPAVSPPPSLSLGCENRLVVLYRHRCEFLLTSSSSGSRLSPSVSRLPRSNIFQASAPAEGHSANPHAYSEDAGAAESPRMGSSGGAQRAFAAAKNCAAAACVQGASVAEIWLLMASACLEAARFASLEKHNALS